MEPSELRKIPHINWVYYYLKEMGFTKRADNLLRVLGKRFISKEQVVKIIDDVCRVKVCERCGGRIRELKNNKLVCADCGSRTFEYYVSKYELKEELKRFI